MLSAIKFLIVGVLIDFAMIAALLAYLWRWMLRGERGPATPGEFWSYGVFILWIGTQYTIGLWPVSIPLLAAPPALGLWKDLKDRARAGGGR